MSAFVVGQEHIDALVTLALRGASDREGYWHAPLRWDGANGTWPEATPETADRVGSMLWRENVASIHGRYPDTAERDSNYPGPIGFSSVEVEGYRHDMVRGYEPVDVLKVLGCYEHQSCEHAGWATSQAARFCQSLRLSMISHLPGYNEAPCGIDDVKFFRLREMGA